MERITSYEFSSLIEAGFNVIPSKIADKLKYVHFFTGTDPIYAGLHDVCISSATGRSYRNTVHVMYDFHFDRFPRYERNTTIVLPLLPHEEEINGYPMKLLPMTIVHELGHVLDSVLNFNHIAEPVSDYAKLNRQESFAEAFTLWVCPEYAEYYPIINIIDRQTLLLFEKLTNYGI